MYNLQLYIAIILFSSSALAFEISLTRIFSIALSYHFAFMIITIAMLGIGLSGTILSLYPILKRGKNIPIYGVFLGLSMSLSFIISKRLPFDPFRFPWDKTQFIYIVLYWLLISLPFFFSGLCISTILSVKSEKSGYLYASDLIGAGTGSVEAFESFLKALKKDGLLSITLFITPPPRMELRIMDTLIEAAERIGLKEIHRSTAVIRTWDTVTIIVKKSVFEEAELQKIRTFLNKRRFDIVYLPGVKEEETNRFIRMDKNEYFMAFKSLLTPGMRKIFKTTYAFDISYVTDNSPFFYYFINMKKLKEIYHIMGKKWQFFIEEGLLPFFLLIPIVPFGLLIIIMPALSIKKRPPFYPLVYFSMIGIGFMFVEVTLIHRMVLLLENPSYAFATVLTSLLLWSGIGSMLSQKMDKLRITLVPTVLFITVIFYNYFVLTVLLDQLHHLSITYRIIAIFFSLSALGLLMGFPFPSGIKRLGAQCPDMIPWAWAVNGFFSVLSPILAMILAISMGFEQVLLIGAIAYLIASFLPLQS